MDELHDLESRIFSMYENRKVPDEILNIIKEIEKDYEDLCSNFLKENIQKEDIDTLINNVVKYSRNNLESINSQIINYYGAHNELRINRIIDKIKEIEEKSEGKTLSEREENIKNSVGSSVKNHSRVTNITEIVKEGLQNSKNQLFRILEQERTPENKKDFIYSQIKMLENKAKLLMESKGYETLQKDDEEVKEDIIREYEEFVQEKYEDKIENKKDSSKNDFKAQYEVSDEVKENIDKTREDIVKKQEEEKENKIEKKNLKELPGDFLE